MTSMHAAIQRATSPGCLGFQLVRAASYVCPAQYRHGATKVLGRLSHAVCESKRVQNYSENLTLGSKVRLLRR